MRLLSWNINGIRTLPMYHPWNTLKTLDNILKELNADIICFQEMKSTRPALERHVALPTPFDAFFSFPVSKGGYSGVGVFTNSEVVVPLKAEEGLSGRIQPKPPLSDDERISPSYPLPHNLDLVPDEHGNSPLDLLELDKEGRALMIDFGLFVLINVYCPNETSDARLPYKLNYHLMLEERVRKLIEEEHREVIVVGDMNICAAPIDHCDGALASKANDFWEHPARSWYQKWLAPNGPMYDVIRDRWPDRKGMYTCWNQKIGARATNYGTRIDYFLLTKGLLRWFKDGDIQPAIKGSDHCPVYIDFYDEITIESGETILLKDVLKMNGEKREPPRICAKHWDEFSHKQKLLSSFFVKKPVNAAEELPKNGNSRSTSVDATTSLSQVGPSSTPDTPPSSELPMLDVVQDLKPLPVVKSHSDIARENNNTSASQSSQLTSTKVQKADEENTSQRSSFFHGKRKNIQADSNYPAQKAKKQKKVEAGTGQKKLSSFFVKPDPGPSSSQSQSSSQQESGSEGDVSIPAELYDITDFQDYFSEAQFLSSQKNNEDCKKSWSQLFAKVDPPKCTMHNEPTHEYTVNKPGPNKGKKFYICSRPVGPGYDAGKSVRLREEVDPRYRCNFFKWSSEHKQDALRGTQKKSTEPPS